MGICASCLGLNRHPSQHGDEAAPLLDDTQPTRYGTSSHDEQPQPDEEELQREREALSQITTNATEGMIDVMHPDTVDVNTSMTPTHTLRDLPNGLRKYGNETDSAHGADEADEQAWLDSIQNSETDAVTQIKPLRTGGLVLDMAQLREQIPQSARKTSKSAVGRL